MTTKIKAFTVIELLIVVAVLVIVAALLLPGLTSPHQHVSRINCSNNLKQVGLSFVTWAIDNNDQLPMEVAQTNGAEMKFAPSQLPWGYFQVMSNELSTPKILFCPQDTSRKAATNFTSDLNNTRVSYFVNLDAQNQATNMVLCGDRNLSIAGVTAGTLVTIKSNSAVSWTAELHKNSGNILMVDGSVQQATSSRLRDCLVDLPEAGVRLSIP